MHANHRQHVISSAFHAKGRACVVTKERLHHLFTYLPDTGDFVRNVDVSWNAKRGDVAGSINRHGYVNICVDRRMYRANRLAWIYVYGRLPDGFLDHINGDKADNRIANLRPATASQNGANRGSQRNNKSGLKGVCWLTRDRVWRASLTANGKTSCLGHFRCPAAASLCYQVAADKAYGEFAAF